MPKEFWAEAAVWSYFILNRCPTKSLDGITPYEAWYGVKPNVKDLRVWGCIAQVHIPKEKRTKLDSKSKRYVLVGRSEESKAYRLIDPSTKTVIISRDVLFEEDKSWNWEQSTNDSNSLVWEDSEDILPETETEDDDGAEINPTLTEVGEASVTRAREGRQRRPPAYLRDYVTNNEDQLNVVHEATELHTPYTFNDAWQNKRWRKAMDLEMEAIERNNTWELVDLPKETKCIGVKWLYKIKMNEHGRIEKYKARLVAKGYGQEYRIDYTEVYAPVARMDTIRLMIGIAAQKGWTILQMDVKSAFLHGTLTENVYVQQPQGYLIKGHEQKVYKLNKALYGLKQAPRAWFSRIEGHFLKEGFKRSNAELTLFIKKNDQGNVIYGNIYVDDLIFTGDNPKMLMEFKQSMQDEFEMTDLGKMSYFLGIEVVQTIDGIHISQRKYAQEIIKRFKMEECNPVKCPIVPGSKLKMEDGDKVDSSIFKQVVGSLMYITTTRPDIQFAVSLISRFMCDPKTVHFDAAKKVIRYLQGTTSYGIWYKRGGEGEVDVFTDSDFGGDVNDYKSTSGYVVLWNGAAVAWQSKKQSIVALSSTEAEYVAASMCACQIIWVRGVLDDLGVERQKCTTMWCDNTSTIKLSKHTIFHGRCKHIGVRYHFLRDLVKEETINMEHCGTNEQIADIMTKALKKDVFENLRRKFGVCDVKDKLAIEQSG